jgi:hypothetical protein
MFNGVIANVAESFIELDGNGPERPLFVISVICGTFKTLMEQ